MRKPVPPSAAIVLGADESDSPPARVTASGALPPPDERNSRRGSPNSGVVEQDNQTSRRSESSVKGGLPASLRLESGMQSMERSHNGADDLPESLRVGPPRYATGSGEIQRPIEASTYPYLQGQQAGLSGTLDQEESSASARGGYAERHTVPSRDPPLPPLPKGKQPS